MMIPMNVMPLPPVLIWERRLNRDKTKSKPLLVLGGGARILRGGGEYSAETDVHAAVAPDQVHLRSTAGVVGDKETPDT